VHAEIDGDVQSAVVVREVYRLAESIGRRQGESVRVTAVELDLEPVVIPAHTGPIDSIGSSAEPRIERLSSRAFSRDLTRVDVHPVEDPNGMVPHVGGFQRKVTRELPLNGQVPGLDVGLAEPGRDYHI